AGCLAVLGQHVIAVESDPDRRAVLAAGRAPFSEPGLDVVLGVAVRSGRLRFVADVAGGLAEAGILVLCVGTPPGVTGHADTSAVEAVATAIGQELQEPRVVVTKSTVPIGSGYWLTSLIEDAYRGPRPIDEALSVVSCPEFMREGS